MSLWLSGFVVLKGADTALASRMKVLSKRRGRRARQHVLPDPLEKGPTMSALIRQGVAPRPAQFDEMDWRRTS